MPNRRGVFTALVTHGGLGAVSLQIDGLGPVVEANCPVTESIGLLAEGDLVIVDYTNDGALPVVTGKLTEEDVQQFQSTGIRSVPEGNETVILINPDGTLLGGGAKLTASDLGDPVDMPTIQAIQREAGTEAPAREGLHILFGEQVAADRIEAGQKIKALYNEQIGSGLDKLIQELKTVAAPVSGVTYRKNHSEMEWQVGSSDI